MRPVKFRRVVQLGVAPLPGATGLEEEPSASLGLINPSLKQACAGHVSMLVTKAVRLAHMRGQLLIVVAQLGQHIQRRDVVGIVVEDPLQTCYLAN
jgi:hypothetical protein